MSRSISKAGAEELKVLSSASAGAILTFGSADSELKVNLIGNRVYFVSIRGNFTEKSTLLYRLALLVINSFKPLKKPHPNILTFGRVTDAEFGAGRDVHVLRWQLCCKPTELYLWDPTKLNIQPKYEPACLNCGTKAGGDGWAQSVRQLILGSNSLGVGLAGGSGLGAGQAGGNGPGVGQASGNESGMELAGGNGQGVGQVIGNGPDTRGGSAAGALASLRFAGAPALPVPKRSRATATVLAGQKPGAGQGGKDIAKSCRKCGVLIRDKCKHVLERLAKKQKTGE